MILQILITIFMLSLTTFILYNSYNFQTFVRIKLKTNTINSILSETKGSYTKLGYFSSQSKIITDKEFRPLFKRQKANLHLCYSIITFNTQDAYWELFSTLVKESGKFKEVLYLKCYPVDNLINSKVAIEKIHSKLEIYSNSHSLMQILSNTSTMDILNSILLNHEELINIGPKYIQFKSDFYNTEFTKTKILHKISNIHNLKCKIYLSGVKSY